MLHHSFSNIIIANDLQIDFNKLALLHPELRPHIFILGGRTVINFKNQSSLIVLNQAIMKHVFGLNWNCKIENLCPRIPSRVNYLLWINLHSNVLIKQVVDIGTGSTLIYPLLGWKIFGWKFIATEQNKQSILLAQELISKNNLQSFIEIRECHEKELLSQFEQQDILKGVIRTDQAIDITICNPPFFEDSESTLSCMKQYEHHVEGGELNFFFKIYRESFLYSKIKRFSCLIGRISNFHIIKSMMRQQFAIGMLSVLTFGQISQGNNVRFIVLWKVIKCQLLKELRYKIEKKNKNKDQQLEMNQIQ